ncbi:MAG: type II secretion system F family protein [Bdellovibrionales bacterium]|nr:type II secretion system F family protein [Bdellovibrionales bacterium]
MSELGLLILSLSCLSVAAWWSLRGSERSSRDVLEDLEAQRSDSIRSKTRAARRNEGQIDLLFGDELGKLGLFTKEERRRFRRQCTLIPFLLAAFFSVLRVTLTKGSPIGILGSAIFGLILGHLIVRYKRRRRQYLYMRSIEFFLPIIMERIVMAVQAGLDVLSGLKRVIEIAKEKSSEGFSSNAKIDPVTHIMERVCQMTEAGCRFEQALEDTAQKTDSTALRHALVHLALAHKDGGELVTPLTELSNSTQLYFQESVEEEISKMPARATLPLILTFAGLLVCFLTSPLIQIMTLFTKSLPH